MKKLQKGFSLVELMIVIAIIAILAAVAIPMYSNYTARAKIGSALSSIGGVKTEIAESLSNTTAPVAADLSLPTGVTLASSTTTAATIQISLDSSNDVASGGANIITLAGTAANNAITWACASSTYTASQLPSPCTSSV